MFLLKFMYFQGNENNNTQQENRNRTSGDLNNSLKKYNDENDFGYYITKTIKTLKSSDAQKKLKYEIQKVVSQFVHKESMKSKNENLKSLDTSLKYNLNSSDYMVVDRSHNDSYYSKYVMFLIVFLFII